MKLSAFTPFTFSDSLENTVNNIGYYFNWFSLTKGCNLEGLKLSRAQMFELLAASHSYKTYASFKATNDKELLTTLNSGDIISAVDHVIQRMEEVLGVSNKLFAEILVASLNRMLAIRSEYNFKIEASNLICFYIKNYGDTKRSGIPVLTHIYMMALNNIGLSIELNQSPISLDPLIYKHFIADSKSPITDVLKIQRVYEVGHLKVDMAVKMNSNEWVGLCNLAIGDCISENALILSGSKDKISLSTDTIQYLLNILNNSDQHKTLMPQLAESKFNILTIECKSLSCLSDFLKHKLSYSFSEEGENGVFGWHIDENSVELMDTFTVVFYISNNEVTLDIEIAAYMTTEIVIGDAGLAIKPQFDKCMDLIAKVSVTSNDYGDVVVPDQWLNLSISDAKLIHDLYGQLIPNIRKAKYFYACAMDNILSVSVGKPT